jgi:major vault protein
VTLAIEITTKMQEAEAKKQADKNEQEAKAALKKRQIEDEALAEKERRELYNLQAEVESVKTSGQSKTEAKAFAQQLDIVGRAQIEISELQAKARKILEQSKLTFEKEKTQLELMRMRKLKELEIRKAKDIGDMDSGKLKQYVECLGRETLVALARAGPDAQAEILQSLGLKGYMIMDSANPINLFNSASGILSSLPQQAPM